MPILYSIVDDLNISTQRLVELTESDTAIGVRDDVLIGKLGLEASDMIDTKLRGVYVVPFDVVPTTIARIHRRLWKYLLYSHRETMQMPEIVRDDYKFALKELDELGDSKGDALLDAPRVTAESSPGPTGGVLDPDLAPMYGRNRDRLGG